ncbi:MAG: AAA family ATPase [Candidatus Nanoarchaeia archaeon]|nr:AAA family ATPase [Candidatus Nanoarchaeia archaeon]MDD5741368.1 AAA family ATPase [Candidatus Nanoarchaeia archaeon]
MPAKIIIVTGISGSGSRNFCARYNPLGKKVKRYHTGDMLFELAQKYSSTPVLKENLLNLRPDILESLRDNAFEMLVKNLEEEKKDYDIIFIDTHAQFFWNDVYQNAYNWKYLKQINADMFVTIIDKPSAIKEKQLKTPHGRAQTHDLRDLLLWQNVEVNVTLGWALNYEKPAYVFSSKQNPEIINSLLDNKFLIYSSFPMTDAGGEAWNRINTFKEKLRNIEKEIDGIETPIIDPADIDVETGSELGEREREAINRQTVHRDLNWDIAQSTHVIAYYPDDKISLSKGVSDECTRALETGKYVYVVCPREKISPFMNIAHKVFRDEDEFLKFFKEHLKEILNNLKRK